MSWPIRIISPAGPVPKIKWKTWRFSVLLILFFIIFSGWFLRGMKIVDGDNFIKPILPWVIAAIGGYLIALSIRVYYYGVCLSVYDSYENDAQSLREQWKEWASESVYIAANHFFMPSRVSLSEIISGKTVDVANGQALKLDVLDKDFTEEDLFNELLSSVRSEIKKLSSSYVFDVIFTCEENHTSFPLFRECWRSMGVDESVLGNCYFFKYDHEYIFQHVLNAKVNRIYILVSIRVDSHQLSFADTTEFASILLITKNNLDLDKVNGCVAMRPMSFIKNTIDDEFILLRTYQPEVLNTNRVFFSALEQQDIVLISDVLRKPLSAEKKLWEFDVNDLNMVLGKLSDEHFWLVFALSLHFSEIRKEPSLMIHRVGEQVVFNMVKPFDFHKESVN
ncbi:TPA: hypothetical protein U2L65_001921 [Citrobacter farmeri]|uniref:hypothetical protein n=1 Tax=Citrobacter farmeri TaxID=67824 RepID=UPI001E36B19B|nr:hypothetical protein [Citrobacter farmeri]GJL47336.1 hypothetical protein TUM17580_33950 [Citrobacter farmeri]HCD7630672.1 hypothetical protein [Citrobacter farmeri]HEM7970904.1 hypothetical protein [Citrobacter farmeri]HEM7985147.1 hypothetical protein [Citrobacter farmeri]